jgi:hypothetical protein
LRERERGYHKLTSTLIIVAKRRRPEVDALLHGVQRDQRAPSVWFATWSDHQLARRTFGNAPPVAA